MQYKLNVNGFAVNAYYSEETVESIFIPLLKELTEMQKHLGRRILAFLAAPPAAGKSTLSLFLQHLSRTVQGVTPICVIGMDGFHQKQDYLKTHTCMRGSKEILLSDIKGAPETFNLPLLTQMIQRVAAGEDVGWPEYSRLKHDPVENAVTVSGDIVLIEGNYLLLQTDGWEDLKKYADYTIRICAEEKELLDRLVRRKAAGGMNFEEAQEFVMRSDLHNVRICQKSTAMANLTLRLMPDGEYIKQE